MQYTLGVYAYTYPPIESCIFSAYRDCPEHVWFFILFFFFIALAPNFRAIGYQACTYIAFPKGPQTHWNENHITTKGE